MNLLTRKLESPGKIGLALGSGSAKGWAHIGVIEALAEAGIRVDCVAGTSIGAVVGSVFASGRIEVFRKIILQLDWKRIVSLVDFVFPRSGLIDGEKVADFIRGHVAGEKIEDLPLPFRAVATDLASGSEVVIGEGDVIKAVRASISIPGIFTPARIENKVFVDGGLVNPVPVSVLREMRADFVVAVDLNHDSISGKEGRKTSIPDKNTAVAAAEYRGGSDPGPMEKNNVLDILNKRLGTLRLSAFKQVRRRTDRGSSPSIFEVLLTSINILEAQITSTRLQADPPDLLIRPRLGHINFLEFNRAQEAIAEGYREAKKQLAALQG